MATFQPGKAFDDDTFISIGKGILNHLLKCQMVKVDAVKIVVNVVMHDRRLMLATPFFDHETLIRYGVRRILVWNRQSGIAYGVSGLFVQAVHIMVFCFFVP